MILLPQMRAAIGRGPSGPTDPFWTNVVVLGHLDGTNGSTTITNSVPSGITLIVLAGNAAISTTQSVFGGASCGFGTGNFGNTAANPELGFGTADFTIEFRFRPTAISGSQVLYDGRSTTDGVYPSIYIDGSGIIYYYVSTANRITSAASTIAAATWYDVAVSRVSGTTRMFVNGTQVGSNYTDGTNYANAHIRVGLSSFSTGQFTGYIDELRITNGVGRYSGNYTIETAAFPNS